MRQGPTPPASAGAFPGRGISEVALRRAVAQFALTEREVEMLWGLLDGGTETAIASHAAISANTEHTHRRHLFEKLEVHTGPGLALRVFREMLAKGIPPCLGLSAGCPETGSAAVPKPDGREKESGGQAPPPGAAILGDAARRRIAASLRLTTRELELVRGVFNEQKRDAMAADMAVSISTIKTKMRHLFAKLGVRNRSGLMVRVFAELFALGIPPWASQPPECGRCRSGVADASVEGAGNVA